MKILMFSRYDFTRAGGVEVHIKEISKKISKDGHQVSLISSKYDKELDDQEIVDFVNIVRLSYPRLKLIGLIYIWIWMLKNINLIKKQDVLHVHDVFIWILPIRMLLPRKKLYLTNHGWEGVYPVPFKNKLIKRISTSLANGSMSVGRYVDKYYGIKSDLVLYEN